MGLLPEYRGHGLGERLIRAALDAARGAGFERVSLSVYASNARATALYRKVGFVLEGTRVRGRKVDGAYDDMLMMGLPHFGSPADMNFRRLSDIDVRGKRVFIRADLNVPQDDHGAITDDTRIRASVPAIRDALARGAAVMVTSHLGRPAEGEWRPQTPSRRSPGACRSCSA